jgi:orotate phosphoribosyltransferase
MSGNPLDLHAALKRRGALLEGHFRLSSGRHSDRFVQKFRILEDPSLLDPVGAAIAERFRSLQPSIVVSAAVGGILLGYEVARHLGVKAIFVEKESGTPVLRRGFTLSPSDRALVVEDVVTTGLSVGEVIELVRRHGSHVVGVGAMVVRSVVDFGVPTHTLLDLPLRSFPEDECPQCAAGEPVADPGSRRA